MTITSAIIKIKLKLLRIYFIDTNTTGCFCNNNISHTPSEAMVGQPVKAHIALNIYPVSEKFELSSIIQLIPNRMRNLHLHLDKEFGKESVILLQQWENMEKMADVCSDRIFSLGCLKYDVIPLSVRLKTNIRTTRGLEIIRKAETASK